MNIFKILVFAQNARDVIMGCGGLLFIESHGNNTKIRVVLSKRRELSAVEHHDKSILSELGINEVFFLYHDEEKSIPLSGLLIDEYRKLSANFSPNYIMLPSPHDPRNLYRKYTRSVIKSLEQQWKGSLLFYETLEPGTINMTKDITPVMKKKLSVLNTYSSGNKNYDYEGSCTALARLRGVSIGKMYGESFLYYDWDGSKQNFFENYPLISVIIRADNLIYLNNVLRSLVEQEYDHTEVIIVWHGKEVIIEISGFDSLDFRIIQGNKRSYNLNAGISNSNGEYIAIIDQDDVVYSDHLIILLSQLHRNDKYDIAYSGCKVVLCEIKGKEIIVKYEEKVYNEPYQPGKLLTGNYIPIHSILFRKTIFNFNIFDEKLDFYEDWEMLAKLEMSGYKFLHINNITCEYRIYGHHETMYEAHESKGYIQQKNKIMDIIYNKITYSDFEHLTQFCLDIDSQLYNANKKLVIQEKLLENKEKDIKLHQQNDELLSNGLFAIGIKNNNYSGLLQIINSLLPQDKLFSIIMPVYNTDADILRDTLNSLKKQIYTGWELCIVDDASDNLETINVLSNLMEEKGIAEKICYKRRKERGGIVAASNDAVKMSTAPYIGFMDHDDILTQEALLELCIILRAEKQYSLLYTDSRKVDITGKPLQIDNKTSWSPENLLHINYVNHFVVLRKDIFEKVGGFKEKYNGSQDLALLLALSDILKDNDVRHINKLLYDWRATKESIAYMPSNKPYSYKASFAAIKDFLEKKGLRNVTVENNKTGKGLRCNWQSSNDEVHIIITLTKNNVSHLENFLDSITNKTNYNNIKITIIWDDKTSDSVRNRIEKRGLVQIMNFNSDLSWVVSNNMATMEHSSPFILFIDCSVDIVECKWLENMTKYLLLEGVGVVGVILLHQDGTIQHNGIYTDEENIAVNITTWGNNRELAMTRNVSAVSGACLLIKRTVFEDIGGFDDKLLYYNDVDLCLKVRNKGFRILNTHDVQLTYHVPQRFNYLINVEKNAAMEHSTVLMRNRWKTDLTERYIMSHRIVKPVTSIISID